MTVGWGSGATMVRLGYTTILRGMTKKAWPNVTWPNSDSWLVRFSSVRSGNKRADKIDNLAWLQILATQYSLAFCKKKEAKLHWDDWAEQWSTVDTGKQWPITSLLQLKRLFDLLILLGGGRNYEAQTVEMQHSQLSKRFPEGNDCREYKFN